MRRHFLFLGLGLMLALPACSSSSDSGKPMTDYKQNPHPKQRYDITMTIADAPGPFASMEGSAQYVVVNEECLPPPDSNPAGYSSHMTRHIPFTLTPVSETEYTGTVYADMILDEDYHGRGVCRWQFTHAQVEMKATGAESETTFIPNLSAEPLLAEQTKTIYFLKKSYPRHPESTLEAPLAFGAVDRSKMPSNISDDDLFTITLASKRMTP